MAWVDWLFIIMGILVVKYLLIWRFWPRKPKESVRVGSADPYLAANPAIGHWVDREELQKEYEKGEKTANQVRAELGYPPIGPSGDLHIKQEPKPHKHKFSYFGYSWGGKIGTSHLPSEVLEQELIFRCKGCPTYGGASQVKIKRWKWNEMTRNFSEVDQVWPG